MSVIALIAVSCHADDDAHEGTIISSIQLLWKVENFPYTMLYETIPEYNALGRIVRIVEKTKNINDPKVIPSRQVLEYDYDSLGRIVRVQQHESRKENDVTPTEIVLAVEAFYINVVKLRTKWAYSSCGGVFLAFCAVSPSCLAV